jgi:hypothetical protein
MPNKEVLRIKECLNQLGQVRNEKMTERKRLAATKKYGINFEFTGEEDTPLGTQTEEEENFDRAPEVDDSDPVTELKYKKFNAKLIPAIGVYLHQNLSIDKVSTSFRLSPNQLKWGLTKLKNGSLRNQFQRPVSEASKRRPSVFGQAMYSFIYDTVRSNKGQITLRQLVTLCKRAHPGQRTPGLSTISQMMNRMGLNRKLSLYVPPNRNSVLNKRKKSVYMARLILALDAERRVIFIDETGINFEWRPIRHWAPKKHRWLLTKSNQQTTNTSCLIATSQYGLEATLYIDGSCDSVLFLMFIARMVDNQPDFEHPDPSRRPLIVCDNVAFHHSQAFKAFATKRNIEILFTPSYSPMLNSVEFANLYLKRSLANFQLEDK